MEAGVHVRMGAAELAIPAAPCPVERNALNAPEIFGELPCRKIETSEDPELNGGGIHGGTMAVVNRLTASTRYGEKITGQTVPQVVLCSDAHQVPNQRYSARKQELDPLRCTRHDEPHKSEALPGGSEEVRTQAHAGRPASWPVCT